MQIRFCPRTAGRLDKIDNLKLTKGKPRGQYGLCWKYPTAEPGGVSMQFIEYGEPENFMQWTSERGCRQAEIGQWDQCGGVLMVRGERI
jgi:hypothetical protein